MEDFELDTAAIPDLRKLAARQRIRGKPTARDVMHDCQILARGLVVILDKLDELEPPAREVVHHAAPAMATETAAPSNVDVDLARAGEDATTAAEIGQSYPSAGRLASRKGYEAGKAGNPISSCPFGRQATLFPAWSAGWARGREDRNANTGGNAAAVTRYRRRVAERDMRSACPEAPDYPDTKRSKYVGAARRGWFACFAGEPKTVCPYGDGRGASAFRNRWLQGYDLALERKAEHPAG